MMPRRKLSRRTWGDLLGDGSEDHPAIDDDDDDADADVLSVRNCGSFLVLVWACEYDVTRKRYAAKRRPQAQQRDWATAQATHMHW
jgi:hypothetical protein